MRTRWKPLALCAVVLILGVVASYLMVRSGMAHERKVFVTDPDPTSGYRYRFTLSSDWKIDTPIKGIHSGESLGVLSFTPPPPGPFRAWIDEHLLHSSPLPPVPIYADSTDAKVMSRNYQLVRGYPELKSPRERILTRKHLLIDGYRATLFRLEILPANQKYTASFLVISIPEHSEMYLLFSGPEAPGTDQAYRELQQMSASFHIEKPAVPPSGKH